MGKYKSLLVSSNIEFRQESQEQEAFGIKGVETPVSAIVKQLHIHKNEHSITASLESPIIGGPVIECHDGKETILIPGERLTIDSTHATFFIKQQENIQMLIIDN